MKRVFGILALVLALVFITGCSSKYEGLTSAPEQFVPNVSQTAEAPKEVAAEEKEKALTGFETPTELSVKVNEGCFFEKVYRTYIRAGVSYYNLEFRNENGTFGFNFTSKVDTSINIMRKADVGVCIHDKMWQFFYPNGTLWAFKNS